MELDIRREGALNSLVGFGLSGLTNLRNTCYLNTAIQCLKSVTVFSAYFLSNQYQSDKNQRPEAEFVESFSYLLKTMWGENGEVKPIYFKTILGKFYAPYDLFEQQDSCEAYCKIIELLHEGLCYEAEIFAVERHHHLNEYDLLNRQAIEAWRVEYENKYSIITKLFHGQFWNRTKCEECDSLFSSFESFSVINLPISNKTNTLFDCINYYVLSNDMCNDNQITCEKCNKKCNGKKKNSVWRLPPVLTFSFNRYDEQMRKKTKLINFPISQVNFSDLVDKPSEKKLIYDLVAVGNHSGVAGGGHYWAFSKGLNGQWYNFNDDHIDEITDISQLVSENAYYLVYVLRNLPVEACISR